jgi:DNA-binding response OmpR family regulator
LSSFGRVLIADGSVQVREELSRTLLDGGVAADYADCGLRGAELLPAGGYALVVLDLDFDDLRAVLDGIGRLPTRRRPIVIGTTTSRTRPDTDSELVQIIVRKPLRLLELTEMIRGCLEYSPRWGGRAADEEREERQRA